MGDFLLDFRPPDRRTACRFAETLRFLPHIHPHVVRNPKFDLVVTCPEDPELWGPFSHPDGSRVVALAGRVVLPEPDWAAAVRDPRPGGVACKALNEIYNQRSLAGLENLSGNFVLLLWDGARDTFHLVTDCTGVFPAYELHRGDSLLFGSHPDVLALAAGEHDNFDEVSLAEFALTSLVSPPFTYYQRIRAVGQGRVVSIRLQPGSPAQPDRRCYFPLEFRGQPGEREDDLAEEFATAFRQAVARRSAARHGRCAVALSGGLDSRAVLASVDSPSNTFAFTCYDEKNREFQSAEAIARAAGIEFLPYHRPLEYYGEGAGLGMRVSGGMGSIANNHFLGVLPWLREQGAKTLLTGCYCDYLFKGLPLNRSTNPWTGHERLAPYRREFYFGQFWPASRLAEQVRERIDSRYPARILNSTADDAVFQIEQLRTFPLCHEADNAQRLVPQRLTGWFVPVSDPGLMRLYCRIPWRWKLNRSIFRKALRRICSGALTAVPDANTGARVAASPLAEAVHWNALRLRNRFLRLKPTLATNGSWPNWNYYVGNSRRIAALWAQPNPAAADLFRRVLARDQLSSDVRDYRGNELWLMVQLLSLKLWFENRVQQPAGLDH